jgi:hypothetical protein
MLISNFQHPASRFYLMALDAKLFFVIKDGIITAFGPHGLMAAYAIKRLFTSWVNRLFT